ncbi:MAG: LysR family transcriptional regulator [Butyrivibrio sp.]
MTLLSYKIFMTTVEYMSFRKAAEIMELTPSAVSHSISSMEDELGFPLFFRKNNKISLTPNAEILIPYIRQVLMSEDSLELVVDQMKGLERGTVRVGCFNTVCSGWMPEIVRGFNERYPGIDIEIFQGSYKDICGWISNGRIDIGFLSAASAGDIPIEPLYDDRLVAAVPKGFKTSLGNSISIHELAGNRFVLPLENGDADSVKLIRDSGIDVKTSCHVVDDLSVLRMVEAGMGVCILPRMVVDSFDIDVDSYPIEPESYRVIGLACYEPSKSVPAVKKLYDFIVESIKQEKK